MFPTARRGIDQPEEGRGRKLVLLMVDFGVAAYIIM
jgi:hypothetical protein